MSDTLQSPGEAALAAKLPTPVWSTLTTTAEFNSDFDACMIPYAWDEANSGYMYLCADDSEQAQAWTSPDGVTWTKQNPDPAYPGRRYGQAVSYGGGTGSLVFSGLQAGPGTVSDLKDAWHLENRLWKQVAWVDAWPAPREQAKVFDIQLDFGSDVAATYMIGGVTGGGVSFAEVWRTKNGGLTWEPRTWPAEVSVDNTHLAAAWSQMRIYVVAPSRVPKEAYTWISSDGAATWQRGPKSAWDYNSNGYAAWLEGLGLVYFGGNGTDKGQLYILDGDSWTRGPVAPLPITQVAVCRSPDGRQILMGGGSLGNTVLSLSL
jgi:hypothetical protein